MIRFAPVVLVIGSLLVPAAAGAAPSSTVTVLVTTSPGGTPPLESVEGVVTASAVSDAVHLVEVAASSLPSTSSALAALPSVIAVEPSLAMDALAVPTDARYGEQWAHELTGIEEAWDETTGDPSVGVAVLDTGVVGDHPDLVANLTRQVDATRATVSTRTLGANNDSCGLGHGTEVAGVIGAAGDNGRDVAGAAWAVSLIDVAVVGVASSCRMTDASLVTGLGWAADQSSVDIINISFGRQAAACPTAVQAAIDDAVEAGKLVVAAAGNQRHSAASVATIPASCDRVLSVGAVTEAGAVAPYSSTGAWVDLVAPGGDDASGILTLSEDLTTTTAAGTSFAAGYVSGVAALLKSADAGATRADLVRALVGTATDIEPTGRDDSTGWGLVDPADAVEAITGTLPAAKPPTTFPTADHGSARIAGTNPNVISQSVAVSRAVFQADTASHAVIARADDYADALAGSTLAGGWGPVLMTNRTGGLPGGVQTELQRVLPEGGTVYLLGGTGALPSSLEGQIQFMGLTPERLAGTTREATAAAVATEVVARRAELGAPTSTAAVITTARNWPDAAIASSLASVLGAPVLVTPPEFLHDAAADVLTALRPTSLYVVGGTAAVSSNAADAARRAAGTAPSAAVRLAGIDRAGTATQVAAETEAVLRQLTGTGPSVAVGVNVRRSDGFGYILAAAPVLGVLGGVFIPIEGDSGSTISDEVVRYTCGIGGRAVTIGGTGVITQATADRLAAVVAGTDAAC